LQQSIALLAALEGLHATTREGIAAEDRREVAAATRDRVNSRLTWAIFILIGTTRTIRTCSPLVTALPST